MACRDACITSLVFWLSKIVGEAANSMGERYPSRTFLLYYVWFKQTSLSDVRGLETGSKYLGQR